MHYSCAFIILLNTSLCKSVFSTYIFGKLVALLFSTFCVYFFCVKFVVILKFYNIVIYIVRVRCFYSHLLQAICKNKHVIIIWLQLLIKNMPPERFWVLKISFIKKNMDIHKIKECKRNASNKYFFSRKFIKSKFILDL